MRSPSRDRPDASVESGTGRGEESRPLAPLAREPGDHPLSTEPCSSPSREPGGAASSRHAVPPPREERSPELAVEEGAGGADNPRPSAHVKARRRPWRVRCGYLRRRRASSGRPPTSVSVVTRRSPSRNAAPANWFGIRDPVIVTAETVLDVQDHFRDGGTGVTAVFAFAGVMAGRRIERVEPSTLGHGLAVVILESRASLTSVKACPPLVSATGVLVPTSWPSAGCRSVAGTGRCGPCRLVPEADRPLRAAERAIATHRDSQRSPAPPPRDRGCSIRTRARVGTRGAHRGTARRGGRVFGNVPRRVCLSRDCSRRLGECAKG